MSLRGLRRKQTICWTVNVLLKYVLQDWETDGDSTLCPSGREKKNWALKYCRYMVLLPLSPCEIRYAQSGVFFLIGVFLLLSQVCWDTQFLHYNDKEARITVTIFVRIELLPYLIVFVGICCILLCESAFTLQHFFIVYVVRHWTDSYLSSQLTERLCTYLKLPPFISVFLRWEK